MLAAEERKNMLAPGPLLAPAHARGWRSSGASKPSPHWMGLGGGIGGQDSPDRATRPRGASGHIQEASGNSGHGEHSKRACGRFKAMQPLFLRLWGNVPARSLVPLGLAAQRGFVSAPGVGRGDLPLSPWWLQHSDPCRQLPRPFQSLSNPATHAGS